MNKKELNKSIVTGIFYLALTLEIIYILWDKSAFIIASEGVLFRITFLLFTMKMLTTKYSWKEWLAIAFMLLIGYVSYRSSGRNELIRIIVMCAACKNIDIQKILKYIFYATLGGSLIIMILALTGVLGTMSVTMEYRKDIVETRYVFGMGHPNSFHCMFFAITVLGMYVWYQKLNYKNLLLIELLNLILFRYTDSKTGMLSVSVAVLVGIVLYTLRNRPVNKLFYVLSGLLLIAMVLFSLLVAYYGKLYQENGLWLEPHYENVQKIDRLLTGRLSNAFMHSYTHIDYFTLFGLPENTEFMDMGFYRLFYWYGYIPGILYIVMCILLLKNAFRNKDYSALLFITIWNFYNLFESHEISEFIGRNYMFFLWGSCWNDVLSLKAEKNYYCWEVPESLWKTVIRKRG